MKKTINILLILLITLSVTIVCQSNENRNGIRQFEPREIRSIISNAENEANYEEIIEYLTNDAIYISPQGPPLVGREAIKSMLKFFFERNKYESEYICKNFKVNGNSALDEGNYIFTSHQINSDKIIVDTISYKLQYIKSADNWHIEKLIYGQNDNNSLVPKLPLPTGKYSVGRRDFIFTDYKREEIFTENKNDFREVAFQIWYPCIPGKDQKVSKYQTKSVAESSAKFLGWPLFNNSYFQLVESNSYLNAKIADGGNSFPIILYNHGYGGFTSVHQVLLEELASHGFIVVSVGHAYESALFILPDGKVKSFNPKNNAFVSRNRESQSTLIEEIKHNIINAELLSEKNNYYKRLIHESKLNNESTRIWAEDNIFVISKLEELNDINEVFQESLNLSNIGVIGHSLGGATAGQLILKEPNIKAGINLDGFQFGDLLGNNLRKPFMFFGEWRNVNDIFFYSSESDCYLVSVRGFEHSTFTDLPIFSSIWQTNQLDPTGLRALKIQKEFVLEFFNKYLRNVQSNMLEKLSEKFSEVRFESKIVKN